MRGVFVQRNSGSRIYKTILETRNGKIAIGECSKDDALEAAQAIRDFLKANAITALDAIDRVEAPDLIEG